MSCLCNSSIIFNNSTVFFFPALIFSLNFAILYPRLYHPQNPGNMKKITFLFAVTAIFSVNSLHTNDCG